MPIFVLFVRAGVIFDGVFSLWISLRKFYVGLKCGSYAQNLYVLSVIQSYDPLSGIFWNFAGWWEIISKQKWKMS